MFRSSPSSPSSTASFRVALLAAPCLIAALASSAGAAAPAARHAHDDADGHACVTPELAALVRAATEENRKLLGLPAPPIASDEGGIAGAPMYSFYPQAGVMGFDTLVGSFVDLDPTFDAFHDFECRPYTRDGHAGEDSSIRSFARQEIGVPVFAARDGVVVFKNDGEDDHIIFGNGGLGNVVSIDHGDGFESQYWHLKKNSITVSLGEIVKAGQQIAEVGSSGQSFGPHLHFQTMRNTPEGWVVHEPFKGGCNPGESDWIDQPSLDSESLFLYDFGITRTFLFDLPNPWWEPWPLPTDNQFTTADDDVVFWWWVYNFPVDCEIRVKFVRPDGSIADDAIWNWGNTEKVRSFSNWFAWDFQWLGPMVGTWHLQFSLDGQLMIDAPFECVNAIDPDFNHPPQAIGAEFDPPAPVSGDVIVCRAVQAASGKEDLDFDVVRYHYVWRVDGTIVREVTTAAQSDAIPRSTAPNGARVCCSVTPNDGIVDGPGATVSVIVGGVAAGDVNGDGHVNGADITGILGVWGACSCCGGDLNGDGQVNGADITTLLGNWTG